MPSPDPIGVDPDRAHEGSPWEGASRLRWGLAGLWILDAGLQLQPAMFTKAFAGNVLYNAALMYQPAGLEHLLFLVASAEAAHQAGLTVAIAAIQLALGVGLLFPRTLRLALAASAAWALLVWVLGQGLGFLATGTALIEFGAPGSALLYLLLAVLAWPFASRSTERGALLTWSGLWSLGAALHLPFRFAPGAVLAYNFQTAAQLEPGALSTIDYHLARLAYSHAAAFSISLAVIELVLAVGVWLPGQRRRFLVTGCGLSALFWVFGQAMGGIFTGISTDPSSAPAVVILATALLVATRRDPAKNPSR